MPIRSEPLPPVLIRTGPIRSSPTRTGPIRSDRIRSVRTPLARHRSRPMRWPRRLAHPSALRPSAGATRPRHHGTTARHRRGIGEDGRPPERGATDRPTNLGHRLALRTPRRPNRGPIRVRSRVIQQPRAFQRRRARKVIRRRLHHRSTLQHRRLPRRRLRSPSRRRRSRTAPSESGRHRRCFGPAN